MKSREVFAWGMYDFANTIFSALFVTFFFPFYVKTFLGGNEFQIGLVFGISMLLVGLLVPLIGAYSDSLGRRMPFIIVFTVLCCVATLFVAWAPLSAALLLGLIANFCYHAALTTYNALLPRLAKKAEYGWVSGIGIGMGYLGTLVSLAIAYALLTKLGWETLAGSRAIFITTAILFFFFSLFTFFGVRERVKKVANHHIQTAFREVLTTIPRLLKYKGLVPFLIAMFAYTNAITAVIIFLFLYGRQSIGLNVQQFIFVYTISPLRQRLVALCLESRLTVLVQNGCCLLPVFYGCS